MKRLFVLVLLMFFLSGCSGIDAIQNGVFSFSGGSGSSKDNSGPEIDNTGRGLEVKFNLDTQWVSARRLEYTLEVENTGLKPVSLNRESFKLKTMQENVFTADSLKDFEDSIFRDLDELIIYQNQEISNLRGTLIIEEDFFKKLVNTKIDLFLEVDYDYETVFSNNLEIDLNSKDLFSIIDPLSQAAPVQMNKIEFARLPEDEYLIRYYFVDNGPSNRDTKKTIVISPEDMEIKFRGQELTDCKMYKSQGSDYVLSDRLFISKEFPQAIYACKVNFEGLEETVSTTTVDGRFFYDYALVFKETITLPQSRDSTDWS